MLSKVDEVKEFLCSVQEPAAGVIKPGPFKRLCNIINAVKELEMEPKEEDEPQKKSPEGQILALNSVTCSHDCVEDSFGTD